MSNLTGRTLSHYRIEAKLGSGGMGEVYRGVDARLNRPVAVKILPAESLQDEDRRRRFTQESKAASALNHPNIVTIHDVGSEDGIDFIVMEYVEGKTLEQVIGGRPMAMGLLLQHATQIADALAAAHAIGLVHRDLKPTNVMVTDRGLVKVLDFGLAKLTDAAAPSTDEHTKTALAAGSPTERGMIVGTAAYMSPEQAEGRTIDARSDIFSFGSVLYEMATGRRAFKGSTTMSTIAAVLRDEPPAASSITAVPLPHDLEILINRCLKKDPNRRVQHMADLKVALQELKEESDSGRLMTSVPSSTATPGRRPVWAIAAAALVVVAAIAGGWFLWGRGSNAPPVAYEVTRLTFDTGATRNPVVSPDGKLVAYTSDRASKAPNLWLQPIAGGEAVQLTRHEGAVSGPTFSPDGTRLAYSVSGKDAGLYVIATIGGEPRKVAPSGAPAAFSPDGSQLSYHVTEEMRGQLMIVPATGGLAKKIPGDFNGFAPHWSADGSHLLALGQFDLKPETMDWYVVTVSDGTYIRTGAAAALRARKVIRDVDDPPIPAQWTNGSVVFSTGMRPDYGIGEPANVWRIALNPTTFQPEGPAEQLTSGTAQEINPSISADGQLVFAVFDNISDYWTLPVDANAAVTKGPRTQIMKNSAADRQALSLDGQMLFFCSHRGGLSDIRSRDLRTGKETSLVSAPEQQHIRGVNADGTMFMYSVEGPNPKRFIATTSGAPAREIICDKCFHSAISSDVSKLAYIREPDHKAYHLLDIASGASTELAVSATQTFNSATFLPDGKWVALITSRGQDVFLVPVRDSRVDEKEWIRLPQIKPGADGFITFSPDSSTIFYTSPEDGHVCIYAQRLSATKQPAGAPVLVEHLHETNAYGHPHGMVVGADKIVLLMNQGSSNIWLKRPRR